jgi:hypothetical protein
MPLTGPAPEGRKFLCSTVNYENAFHNNKIITNTIAEMIQANINQRTSSTSLRIVKSASCTSDDRQFNALSSGQEPHEETMLIATKSSKGR